VQLDIQNFKQAIAKVWYMLWDSWSYLIY
jgi:hypothetical protein